MEEAEDSNNFRYIIMFNNIYYKIKGKLDLSEDSKIYIRWAKELFEKVTKSLDSRLNPKKYKSYFYTPNLKEIIKCFEEKLPKTKKEAMELKKKFSSVICNLDDLNSNPQAFYKTDDSKNIFNSLEKLILLYNGIEEDKANKFRLNDD